MNMRTAEIGVRMAVGAQREQVVWMILRDSLLLTAAGGLLGIPLAMLVGRALTSALYGVKALDGVSYLLAAMRRGDGCPGGQRGARRPRGKCRSLNRAAHGIGCFAWDHAPIEKTETRRALRTPVGTTIFLCSFFGQGGNFP